MHRLFYNYLLVQLIYDGKHEQHIPSGTASCNQFFNVPGEVRNPKFHEGIAGRFDGIDSPSRVVHINLVFDYFMPGTPMWKPARIVHWGGFTTQFKPPRL
ncbi:hypothetical protein MJO28_013413, partial [Puccinia striiformis f. sp. tritici]